MTKGSYKHTIEHNKKISIARMDKGNGNYKESNEKSALHIYMHNRIPKPEFCVKCHKNKPYDLANISQEYKRDINDWEWLCRKCHMESDGRLLNLNKNVKNPKIIICSNCLKTKEHYGKGLCHNCYDHQRWQKRKLTYKNEPSYLKRKNK